MSLEPNYQHEYCKTCVKRFQEKFSNSEKWEIQCNGIDPNYNIPCNMVKPLRENLRGEEFSDSILALDPVTWAYVEFGWEARFYQEDMLRCNSLRKVVRCGRRTGKCVDVDDLIPLSNGEMVTAKSLMNKKFSILSYKEDTSDFIHTEAYATDNGIQDVYEIILEDGTIYNRTEEHPFLTVNGWINTKNLEKGIKIAVPTKVDRFGNNNIDEDTIKICAYIIGDGNVTNVRCQRFTTKDSRIYSDLNNSLNRFGSKLHKYKSNRKYDYNIVPIKKHQKSNITKLLREYDILEKGSHTKYIPDKIMRSNKKSVSLFLNRLFATDGWSGSKDIGYCSVSRKLIDNLFELLLRFGIRGSIRKRNVKLKGKVFLTYEINIRDSKSIEIFRNEIGIFSKEKDVEKTYNNLSCKVKSQLRFNYYGKEIWKGFTSIEKRNLRNKYKLRYPYGPNKYTIKKASDENTIRFNKFSNDHVGWCKVVSIKNIGKKPTVSIHIPENHTFITNAIEHNTESMAIDMLHYCFHNENKIILVITPYKNQIELIFERLMAFISKSETLKGVIKVTKNPMRMKFNNGSIIKGFTSGAKSKGNADSVRGQMGNRIYLDEMDYLTKEDIDTIYVILQDYPDSYLWASSTPTGRRERFYEFCHSSYFREFYYPSTVNPNWNERMEKEFRSIYGYGEAYNHEILADFGSQVEGVFKNEDIDVCLTTPSDEKVEDEWKKDYLYSDLKWNKDHIYVMGVDWNYAHGQHIVIVEWIPEWKKFRIFKREELRETENRYDYVVKKIIEYNKKYQPAFIYVDKGHGDPQIEDLRRYGIKNPAESYNIMNKLKPIDFGSKIELKDPWTGEMSKKHMKPFIVNIGRRVVEQHNLIIPRCETETSESLVAQMRAYRIERIGQDGRPIFSQGNEHALIALMLALTGFMLEFTDLNKIEDNKTILMTQSPIKVASNMHVDTRQNVPRTQKPSIPGVQKREQGTLIKKVASLASSLGIKTPQLNAGIGIGGMLVSQYKSVSYNKGSRSLSGRRTSL